MAVRQGAMANGPTPARDSGMMNKPPWSKYQDEAAAHFAGLGMVATVEESLAGARATHAVDVVVRFQRYGLQHLWIVECKKWRSRVGKAEVLVLQQVAADVGADRAFLLSERGFQSGAVTAARWSNVTLTALADLVGAAEQDALDDTLAEMNRRLAELTRTMHDQTPYTGMVRRQPAPGLDFDAVLQVHADALDLRLRLQRAIARSGVSDADRAVTRMRESLEYLADRLASFEVSVERLSQGVATAIQDAQVAVSDLTESIDGFFDAVHGAVRDPGTPAADAQYAHAALCMRRIHEDAGRIMAGASKPVGHRVRALMRHLLDRTYLMASDPSLTADELAVERNVVAHLIAAVREAAD